MQAVNAVAPAAGMTVRDAEVYPSSGKLVVGLRLAKASDADPNAGQWAYLTGGLEVDADGHAVRLSDLAASTDDEGLAAMINPLVAQLREKLQNIQQWALANRKDSRIETFQFWSLKIPVVVASAGSAIMVKYNLDLALIVTGALSGA